MTDGDDTKGGTIDAPAHVIEFRPRDPNAPSLRTKGRYRTCSHAHIEVDGETRTAECSDCKETLNVFDAFMEIALDHERVYAGRDHAAREVENLRQRAEQLKVEARRAVAELAKARRGLALSMPERAELELYRQHHAAYRRHDYAQVRTIEVSLAKVRQC